MVQPVHFAAGVTETVARKGLSENRNPPSRKASPEAPEGAAGQKPAAQAHGKSRDGDVVELSRRARELLDEDDRDRIREWARKARQELEEQQIRLLKAATTGKDGAETGLAALRLVREALAYEAPAGTAAGEAGPEAPDAEAGPGAAGPKGPAVPEYWNAENTSQRIVDFATSFAGLHGKNPEAFVEKVRTAIARGFAQAKAMTGELPGEAGRLRRETEDLTLAKLDKWLEEGRASLYNDSARR